MEVAACYSLEPMEDAPPDRPLRRGWTTGTCAAAAARAAAEALWTGIFPASVPVPLPGGARPEFTLALEERGEGWARAGVVKDAGDDPDVTHGALIVARVSAAPPGSGIAFRAGPGVGTVTKPGLPLPVGEPAINPVPRQMIAAAVGEVAARLSRLADLVVEISVPGGEEIAKRTMNPRLGILGGISILGTTGIVVPYSCSAWIHSIHRGIDVARATGIAHVAGSTGSTSEAAIARLDSLPETALIDMGDFVGGMLKYLRAHPVARVTIAGGFAKMAKLAQGLLDLHSKRGAVDHEWLAGEMGRAGASPEITAAARAANSALETLTIARAAGVDIGARVARGAWDTAKRTLGDAPIALDVVVFDREGALVGRYPAAGGA